MSLRWNCPHCQKEINVPLSMLGQSAKCPNAKCGQTVTIPLTLDTNPAELRKRWTPQRIMDTTISAVIAVVLHAAFIIIGAYFVSGSVDATPGGIAVAIGELPQGDDLTQSDPGGLDTQTPTAESSASEANESIEVMVPVGTGTGATTDVEVGDIKISAGAGGGSDVDFSGSTGGGGAGGGGGGFGGRARFMGVEATGRRFLIIADNSGSMAGPPLERVKKDIERTLNELAPGAEFYIIFFNSAPDPLPGGKWHKARGDVGKAMTWVRNIQSAGGTVPDSAFQMAFQMKPRPDAIYFMTDGIFAPSAVQVADQLNRTVNGKKVPVHTIAFITKDGEQLLRQIAKQSGGTYRYVPGF